MTIVARIDDEIITAEQFIKILTLNNKLEDILEEVLEGVLTVHVAKKNGIEVSMEEVQQRSDQYRRVNSLHRSTETIQHFEDMGVSIDDFEKFITDSIYYDRIRADIATEQAVEAYFRLHSPKFDAIECSHILLNSEGAANELMAILEDDASLFDELATEHSICPNTKGKAGGMGKVLRGTLDETIEAKLFNASEGDVVGVFQSSNELFYEIFIVKKKFPAILDSETKKSVREILYKEWLMSKADEHRIEVM